jgi:hypothetical protein
MGTARMVSNQPTLVIPAKTGIQENKNLLDPGFHQSDAKSTTCGSALGPSS